MSRFSRVAGFIYRTDFWLVTRMLCFGLLLWLFVNCCMLISSLRGQVTGIVDAGSARAGSLWDMMCMYVPWMLLAKPAGRLMGLTDEWPLSVLLGLVGANSTVDEGDSLHLLDESFEGSNVHSVPFVDVVKNVLCSPGVAVTIFSALLRLRRNV